MATEVFPLSKFEAALPHHKVTGEALCVGLGLVDGEYAYVLRVSDHVNIEIRSSVGANGYAHSTGEDSIRSWLVDREGRPIGSKIQSYVTRVPGWGDRLIKVLRELVRRGRQVEQCPVCGKTMGIYKVKKAGPTKGKLFVRCTDDCKQFRWVA